MNNRNALSSHRSLKSLLFFGLAIFLAMPLAHADEAAVEEAVRKVVPNIEEVAIAETVIPGLYEVNLGSDIVYVTDDGQYLMQGRLIDLETREDLTERSKSKQRLTVLKNIDRETEIVFAPENPIHELTVFTDIDCGYCRKLHAEMAAYNEQGIAIRYMMFPRAGLESNSYDKAVSVWCSDDKQTALTLAKAGTDPEPTQCENPIKYQYETGISMGVTGTPALFTKEGVHIPGYVPPEQLRSRLDAMTASSE